MITHDVRCPPTPHLNWLEGETLMLLPWMVTDEHWALNCKIRSGTLNMMSLSWLLETLTVAQLLICTDGSCNGNCYCDTTSRLTGLTSCVYEKTNRNAILNKSSNKNHWHFLPLCSPCPNFLFPLSTCMRSSIFVWEDMKDFCGRQHFSHKSSSHGIALETALGEYVTHPLYQSPQTITHPNETEPCSKHGSVVNPMLTLL